MRIKKETIRTLNLNTREVQALETTNEILLKLLTTFGSESEITSVDTGEVIELKELFRVRGIIGGIADHNGWTVKIKD